VAQLIRSLDVEERAIAKDTREKALSLLVPIWYRRNIQMHLVIRRRRTTSKRTTHKPKQTTTFKKKKNKNGGCFVCGSNEHWASSCPDHKFKQEKKSANMVISKAEGGTSGYGNFLPTVLSVCHSPEWWMDTRANIHVCADASLFSSYQVSGTGALLMGNGSDACVFGVRLF